MCLLLDSQKWCFCKCFFLFFVSGNSDVVENFVAAVFLERKSVLKQGRKFVRFFFLRGHWKTVSRLKKDVLQTSKSYCSANA